MPAADAYAAECLERATSGRAAAEGIRISADRCRPTAADRCRAFRSRSRTSSPPRTCRPPTARRSIEIRFRHADAWVVERLRNLGATIFGKTVSTEFAWRHPGPTVNPWKSAHTPGGSSSGSAAAVAAGLVPLAVGIANAGLGGASRGLQRRGRLQAELWRDPARRRAPLERLGSIMSASSPAASMTSRWRCPCSPAAATATFTAGRWLFQVDIDTGLTPLARPRLRRGALREMVARGSRAAEGVRGVGSRNCARRAPSSKRANGTNSMRQLACRQHHHAERGRADPRQTSSSVIPTAPATF